jgi:hypothetical protein
MTSAAKCIFSWDSQGLLRFDCVLSVLACEWSILAAAPRNSTRSDRIDPLFLVTRGKTHV